MEFYNDIGGDPLKPSLFELVAQEQLRDLLQPALKYVLSVRMSRDTRNAGYGSHHAHYSSGLCPTIPSLLVAYRKQTRGVLCPTHGLRGEVLPQNLW